MTVGLEYLNRTKRANASVGKIEGQWALIVWTSTNMKRITRANASIGKIEISDALWRNFFFFVPSFGPKGRRGDEIGRTSISA
jgi:hypothetical protein